MATSTLDNWTKEVEEELPLLPGMKYLSPGPLDIFSSSVSSCSTGGDSVRAMPSSYMFSGSMMDHLPNSIVPHLHTVKQATSSAGSVVPNEAWEGAARWTLPVPREPLMDPGVLINQGDSKPHIGVPVSEVYPGPCGFKAHFPTDKYTYSTNSLLLQPDKGFPVSFQFLSSGPPRDSYVRALVCYKNPRDVLKFGACTRCFRHPAEDGNQPSSYHFLVCTNSRACYGVHLAHKIVTVPLEGLVGSDDGPTCVYKCVCHSSCVVGRGRRNKPSLILILSLIHKGNEIGRDVVNICCCSNPNRIRKKHPRQADDKEEASPSFPKLRRGQDLYDNDPDLDQEGYYNFTWRGKERDIFNLLNVIKQGQRNGPSKQ
ncbi:cellular tumor antigen p53-like isoform X2 [Halichondria panicea]|uniref:cellular tumor antigen p53-like isoform X2 n=1 Tax=Halichondria panicea TaxID=6063 RepID=UPI00312B55D8